MKILAVDDIEQNRHFLQELLEKHGYAVETASNGAEALEKARESLPDMVITDILMPRMDGFQLGRTLKNDEKLKNIPVLFYSATYTDKKSRELALEIGVEEYITKPIEPEKLIKIIEETFEKHERGELKPAEKPLEEPVYMELYNERLIQKLEKKMLDLESSEAKYRSVVEAADDLICLIDREYRFLTCNKKSLELFGLTPEDVVGRAISGIITDPDDAEFCMQMVREVFETGKHVSRERGLDFGGGQRWYGKKMAPVFGAGGSVTAVACVARDITERKRAEEALRESEKRYVLTTDAGQVGVWDWNLETDGIYLDPNLKAMLGYADHEIRNHLDDWGKHVHPDDVEQVMAAADAHLEGLTPQYEVAHRMVHKDGSVRWFLARGTALRDADGKPYRVVGTDTDVTERKRAEERIEHLNSVLKAIQNVNHVIREEKDRDSLLQKACDALRETRNYDAAWFGFLCDSKTFATVKGSGFNEDIARLNEYVMGGDYPLCIKNALAHKEMLVIVDKSRECGDCPFKDACAGKATAIIRVEHADRFFGVLAISLADDVAADDEEKELLKEMAGDIGFALHDMEMEEARKQVGEALRESELRFRNLLENVSNISVQGYGPDGTVHYWNKASETVYDYTREEAIGKNLIDLIIPPEMRDDVREYIKHGAQTGEMPPASELLLMRKDGTLVPVFSSHAVVQPPGREPEMFCLDVDLTELKRAEQELARYRDHLEELVNEKTSQLEEKTRELEQANIRLQELDRLKSMFIASMSHELRTPLNSIIGFTGMILQGLSGEVSKEANEELEIVYDSAQHLLSLINDIIDISKIEANQLEAYFEEVNLDEVLRDAVTAVLRDAEAKKLEIKTDFSRGLRIISDRKRLLQCVLNLLNNAVKFTEHGTIELTATKEVEILKISVSDTGIGIKEEDIPKLFTPFTRLDSPLKERTLGTGLGLYLTKKIMKNVFYGNIMVESQYGRGSTFTLIIPVPSGAVV